TLLSRAGTYQRVKNGMQSCRGGWRERFLMNLESSSMFAGSFQWLAPMSQTVRRRTSLSWLATDRISMESSLLLEQLRKALRSPIKSIRRLPMERSHRSLSELIKRLLLPVRNETLRSQYIWNFSFLHWCLSNHVGRMCCTESKARD